ncbi:aldehyde dehydrogenase [Metschnikowia bicuspidata var. bicuspidata NRRL YB-4993]|uniref:Aldehyde dehydrogenase n=1 Tax=Metschnikowia bicuspidata var. bicuspidata NRRL YB-4993 TaxID=869754 RepID=A0A1A0HFI4_9ASCO|nr:aldehyde dehydrogenase [Metschnikowia bicuspidata var. bicuspidata NRRL YB-4993]OBA22909.1 aldehyde dehydrogenase [Metschnikowia bicuspidata var. bicuspidata NRRL YB-4993]
MTKKALSESLNVSEVVSSTDLKHGIDSGSVLEYTPTERIPEIVNCLRTSFHKEHKTHSLQFRLNQLRNIYFAVKDSIGDITDALYKDFSRSPSETMNLEYAPFMNELVHTMANLQNWSKREPINDVPLNLKTAPAYIERVPLGTVLVISPFNYPLFLSLSSVIGALSAGNCVVLKVSELVPNFAQVLTRMLTDCLDPSVFAMINGGIEETTVLLDQKFDKIMYTGSTAIGKIIAKKAAETLTPVLLELGGKSPAFVLDTVTDKDVKVIARRIVWGRFTNAGQTCVAIDYVLVDEKVKKKLVAALKEVVEDEFYSKLNGTDSSFTHIIHERAFSSITKMIEDTKGDIVTKGKADSKSRFIPPTVIDNVDWDDSTMQQEIFGPVLPVLTYKNLEDAIEEVTRRHDTPLALYIFTSGSPLRLKDTQIDLIRLGIRSGGTMVNDSILHVSLPNAPFGGIGQSGQGAYHGFYSYKAFTHERTTIESSLRTEFTMKVRYPPSMENKDKVMQASMIPYNQSVWFGRTGDVGLSGPGSIWSLWHRITEISALVYRFASV